MRYVLRCFPKDDRDFRLAAEVHLGAVTRSPYHDRDEVPDDLAAALRPEYPDVTVYRAHELAEIEPDAILYVYRDGTPRHGDIELQGDAS